MCSPRANQKVQRENQKTIQRESQKEKERTKMEKEKESLQIRIRRVQWETSVCKTIDPREKEKETQKHVTYVDALVTWLKTAGILVR